MQNPAQAQAQARCAGLAWQNSSDLLIEPIVRKLRACHIGHGSTSGTATKSRHSRYGLAVATVIGNLKTRQVASFTLLLRERKCDPSFSLGLVYLFTSSLCVFSRQVICHCASVVSKILVRPCSFPFNSENDSDSDDLILQDDGDHR